MEKVLKVVPGMVIEFQEAPNVYPHLLVLGRTEAGDIFGYRVYEATYYATMGDLDVVPLDRVTAVYGISDYPGCYRYPKMYELLHILGSSRQDEYLLWRKQKVVELTVDEISKKLGYTVKVIGNKEDKHGRNA